MSKTTTVPRCEEYPESANLAATAAARARVEDPSTPTGPKTLQARKRAYRDGVLGARQALGEIGDVGPFRPAGIQTFV